MDRNFETMKFTVGLDTKRQAREIMDNVYQSLKEKGYNPISQIVGY
ncbi:MAG: IreB family regulatory phosphoprotein, partial [Clostridia bacterium]|nr:IreB family regulatory phosphoprotein [Clostridia bacterium]